MKFLFNLGRQGSPKILENLMRKLDELNKSYCVVLMSEIFPGKLKLFDEQIDAYFTFYAFKKNFPIYQV